ncbi:MAG: hypothetical protein IT306_22795 [Chloroflexi bacterium]|nr:hypothetical protein [Chloroflexota bacterium]
MGVGTVTAPALWVLIPYSLFGGAIESNLPPGATPGFLLGLLVIGALMTLVYVFIGYRDHVFPYRMIEDSYRPRILIPIAASGHFSAIPKIPLSDITQSTLMTRRLAAFP